MQLNVRDVSHFLKVPENRIYQWVADGSLPAQRINSQYYFNKSELLEWAALNRVEVSWEIFQKGDNGNGPLPTVTTALHAGGIFYNVEGTDKDSMLQSVVNCMTFPEEFDKDLLLQLLLARESHGSTAIGDGIAIPHPRSSVVAPLERASLTLCFLKQPIPFDAPDKKPVDTIFALLAPNVKTHLHLLARLSFVLCDPGFKQAILAKSRPEEIFAHADRLAAAIA